MMNSTPTGAASGTQADASQELTSPVETSLFQTPAMAFGEVGEVGHQMTTGYDTYAHTISEFDSTRILERMRFLHQFDWSFSSTGTLHAMDVDKALREYTDNATVLEQFELARYDIEVTFRLNTSQFYYGALMVTMWPTNSTGSRVDERAVLDPTIISASMADSVIKEWKYSWPMTFRRMNGALVDTWPVNFHVDVVAPLRAAKDSMPDHVECFMWARFKNIKLGYPIGLPPGLAGPGDVLQSSKGKAKCHRLGASNHPVDDSKGVVGKVIDVVENATIGDVIEDVKSLGSFVMDNWGAIMSGLSFLLDKPDLDLETHRFVNEPSSDMYVADMPDTSVSVSMYKGRYVDPYPKRMPMTKNWTVSDYARIPGLRRPVITFVNKADSHAIPIIVVPQDTGTYKTPLDWAHLSAYQWRGSTKIALQFLTSTFISARFVVELRNRNLHAYPADYSTGISKVIDVKGDTLDVFTFPWLNDQWWEMCQELPWPEIKITLKSDIVSADSVEVPVIYCLVWVAGGDDIQFAFPRLVDLAAEWPAPPTRRSRPLLKKSVPRVIAGPDDSLQCSIAAQFSKTFPPVGEGCQYDIDHGHATFENLGPITDIMKRYARFITGNDKLDLSVFDQATGSSSGQRLGARLFTFLGQWRSAFLFRSGGFRVRWFTPPVQTQHARVALNAGIPTFLPLNGTIVTAGPDNVIRLSIPQVGVFPFVPLGYTQGNFQIEPSFEVTLGFPQYVAARDDVQIGYPILPSPYPHE